MSQTNEACPACAGRLEYRIARDAYCCEACGKEYGALSVERDHVLFNGGPPREESATSLPNKSIRQSKAKFCDMWRRNKTDTEFISFIEALVAEKDPFRKRENVRALLALKPGDSFYDITTDSIFEVIE